MLLAEALRERADTQRRLEDLERRIHDDARVDEDAQPVEDPQVLVQEAIDAIDQIAMLDRAVHTTNAATRLATGRTLAEVVAHRATLRRHLRLLDRAISTASDTTKRDGRTVAVLDVTALRAQAYRFSLLHQTFDVEIERMNRTTELTVEVCLTP